MTLHPRHHQHDLHVAVAERVVAAARLPHQACVYEPGAGTGQLTGKLLAAGATVHAVELERGRARALRENYAEAFAIEQLNVLVGDALVLTPRLPDDWHLVANPPFKHSADLIRRVLVDDVPLAHPTSMTLVLQREAVNKWCGGPKGYSRSSVLARLFGRPQLALSLKRDDVEPPSHVDLAVLHLPRSDDAPSRQELARIDRVLAQAFAGAHRVRDALRGLATPAICKRQGAEHGWSPEAHPRALEPSAWRALTAFLYSIGKLG